jgi:osmotically inducible protein OsmC
MGQLTSEATGIGGRTGTIQSATGSYKHQVTMEGSQNPGVTPEELIAGAWAACYGTTLTAIAASKSIDASKATITARITLDANHETGEYTIVRAELDVNVEESASSIDEIIAEAHGACPVSKLISNGVEQVDVRRR